MNIDRHSMPPARIYDDITQTIGHTPLIYLHRLARKYQWVTTPMVKVEYFNPAGSIKDRPALAMLKQLMNSAAFNQDTQIIEASSGNNGVACAWLGALYDIKVTIVIPEHMSIERQRLIRHYGADVITTPKQLGTKGAIDKARQLVLHTPGAVALDQFANPANVKAHAQTTAQELLHDTAGQIDVLVAGIGTGGTITGLAQTIKQQCPALKVIGIEPARCPVLSEKRSGVHNIQGLSSGHIPDILDPHCIDKIMTVEDDDAIGFARLLATCEGLAVGISSGAAMHATAKLCQLAEYRSKKIVTILPDGAERYFSTELFVNSSDSQADD